MNKEFEDLLGQYWDLAHLEGKSGVSQGDKANEVLHALKKLAEQPSPPPECQTEAEKTAFAFGWFKALESVRQQPAPKNCRHCGGADNVICAGQCKDKPAQQEPVAYLVDGDLYYPEEIDWETLQEQGHTVAALYTSLPSQRKPLTDEEITQVANETYGPTGEWEVEQIRLDFARAIEAAHGIKENT